MYRTYDIDNPSGQTTNINELIKVHAPQLRDANYAAGFNDILKRIEFECDLSYGDLSDPQQVDKTQKKSNHPNKGNMILFQLFKTV